MCLIMKFNYNLTVHIRLNLLYNAMSPPGTMHNGLKLLDDAVSLPHSDKILMIQQGSLHVKLDSSIISLL